MTLPPMAKGGVEPRQREAAGRSARLGEGLVLRQPARRRALRRRRPHRTGEKDAELAQKLGQLQPFIAVFPQGCMGQLGSFGPT